MFDDNGERIYSEQVRKAFKRYVNHANKHSPHILDERRWCMFVILSYCFNERVDGGDLSNWLLNNGWRESEADRLGSNYNFGFELLKEYDAYIIDSSEEEK